MPVRIEICLVVGMKRVDNPEFETHMSAPVLHSWNLAPKFPPSIRGNASPPNLTKLARFWHCKSSSLKRTPSTSCLALAVIFFFLAHVFVGEYISKPALLVVSPKGHMNMTQDMCRIVRPAR